MTETKADTIRCDACPVLCRIRPGKPAINAFAMLEQCHAERRRHRTAGVLHVFAQQLLQVVHHCLEANAIDTRQEQYEFFATVPEQLV